ncbi:MAG TPA: hypothetical protein VNM45_09140 [Bacillus sp. (in: firmicutes)]|nr:hypothetical protein [Bacillus sp. (in: firmicutes)]
MKIMTKKEVLDTFKQIDDLYEKIRVSFALEDHILHNEITKKQHELLNLQNKYLDLE